MPSITSRGYPYPFDTDPIDVAGDIRELAEALTPETVRRFASIDALNGWLSPPSGSVAWANLNTAGFSDQGLYFQYQHGRWWPIGEMLYTTKSTNWAVPVDDTWYAIPWDLAHLNINNQYPWGAGTYRWRAPYTGFIDIHASASLSLTNMSGVVTVGDFHAALSVYRRNTAGVAVHILVISNFRGQFGLNRLYGSAGIFATAGETYEVAIYTAGATGYAKNVIGGDHGVGFAVRYLGAGMPVVGPGPLLADTFETTSEYDQSLIAMGLPPFAESELIYPDLP